MDAERVSQPDTEARLPRILSSWSWTAHLKRYRPEFDTSYLFKAPACTRKNQRESGASSNVIPIIYLRHGVCLLRIHRFKHFITKLLKPALDFLEFLDPGSRETVSFPVRRQEVLLGQAFELMLNLPVANLISMALQLGRISLIVRSRSWA